MKKTAAFVVLAAFVALLSCYLVEVGQAGSISVGTYDTKGLAKDTFGGGEDVRIRAESTHMPITIDVTDPDGVVVYSENYDGVIYDKILSGITEKEGWYTVEASSPIDNILKNYACTYLHVIPEIPLATLGATATMLFGLGFYCWVRRKNTICN